MGGGGRKRNQKKEKKKHQEEEKETQASNFPNSHPSTSGLPAACAACTLSTTDCRETSEASKRVPEAFSDHCLSANESRKKTSPKGRGC